jgi:hypothetical protein
MRSALPDNTMSISARNHRESPVPAEFLDPQRNDWPAGSGSEGETLRKDTGAKNPQDDAFERGPAGVGWR